MKHIKIAFVLLAAIFVSLSSFNKKSGGIGDVKWFNFIGSPGSDEFNPQAYEVDVENTACNGQETTLCGIEVEADDIDGLHPKQAKLDLLMGEAQTQDPEVFLADTYTNGRVRVIAE